MVSFSPTRGQTGGVPSARSTQDSDSRFPCAGLGSSNFVWGAESGPWREGGRGAKSGGPSAKPRPRPQVRPVGGGGNFRSALGKRGAGASRRGRWPFPRPFLGRGSGPAHVPSLAFDQLVPDPPTRRARGTNPTGQGATRGRSHPVSAVGEGAVRRAFRSPGYAAEDGICGPRATGILGRGAGQADEFPAPGAGTAPGGGGERDPGTWSPLGHGTRERGGGPPVMPEAP